METDLSEFSPILTLDPAGYWISPGLSQVSYPEEGNDLFYGLEDDSYWFQHRTNCITEVLSRYPPNDPGPFFDIGAGNGIVAKRLQLMGFDVVAVEPGPMGAQNALKRGVKQVVCSSVENARFLESTLPAVGLFDVLEHIKDDGGFLCTVRDLLTTHGRLYITVPAYRLLWSHEDDHAGHFRRYNLGQLSEVIRIAGFQIVFSTYIFFCLVPAIFLFRTLPDFFRKNWAPESHKTECLHTLPKGLPGQMLSRMFTVETERLRKGKQIPIGASCLLVADVKKT